MAIRFVFAIDCILNQLPTTHVLHANVLAVKGGDRWTRRVDQSAGRTTAAASLVAASLCRTGSGHRCLDTVVAIACYVASVRLFVCVVCRLCFSVVVLTPLLVVVSKPLHPNHRSTKVPSCVHQVTPLQICVFEKHQNIIVVVVVVAFTVQPENPGAAAFKLDFTTARSDELSALVANTRFTIAEV
jgi:uncharacterized membrane protein YhaH (DUF805 family)